ncbi:MAG TPA: MBL fold metallo-hydrolase, partial [Methylomirabilota bacterium]|nr:MBL fold metallo-hydrolase [Methylomirabilota bacterium]
GHLLVTRWIAGQNAPFEVFGPAGTRRQVERLLAWLEWDVEVRRRHMHDRRPPEVRVTEIEEGKVLERDGVTVSAFLVEHEPVRPAFGYHFAGGGRSVVVSGDTRPCENLVRWSHRVDCLVHECCEMAHTSWVPGCGWPTREAKVRDLAAYHTQPDQLGRVAAEAHARKLAVTHLMPGSVPAELRAAVARDYAGPVVVGEDLLEV